MNREALSKPQKASEQQVIGISVIIPTYCRVLMCETLLASLQISQQACTVPSEIWMIDDSPESDAQKIQAACDRYGANYSWNHGPVAQKRNIGAHKSRYSILLFVDSDCIATPGLLQGHWDTYQQESNCVAVVGKTDFKGAKPCLWEVIELTPYLDAFAIAHCSTWVVWGPSNNLSCRRETFESLGGFDETGPQPIGGEDAEFGYRLYYQGHMMRTCPDALIYHTTETWNTLPQVLVRLLRWSRGDIYLKLRYWQDLYYDCPSRFGTVLLLVPVGAVIGLFFDTFLGLLLPAAFLIISFASRIVQQGMISPKRWLSPLKLLAAESLILFYDTCSFVHCLRHRFLLPLFSCMLFRPEDALILWNSQIIQFGIRCVEIVLSGYVVWTLMHLNLS
ncbi:MAG: glycosyltransferase [Cyanobacteria bacterium P01_E01_bin.6]